MFPQCVCVSLSPFVAWQSFLTDGTQFAPLPHCRKVRNTVYRTSVPYFSCIHFRLIVYTGQTITLFPDDSIPEIVTLGYVVTMALESSFRREETSDAQQNREDADESDGMRQCAICLPGSGVSVMLWDEIAPAPAYVLLLVDDLFEI